MSNRYQSMDQNVKTFETNLEEIFDYCKRNRDMLLCSEVVILLDNKKEEFARLKYDLINNTPNRIIERQINSTGLNQKLNLIFPIPESQSKDGAQKRHSKFRLRPDAPVFLPPTHFIDNSSNIESIPNVVQNNQISLISPINPSLSKSNESNQLVKPPLNTEGTTLSQIVANALPKTNASQTEKPASLVFSKPPSSTFGSLKQSKPVNKSPNKDEWEHKIQAEVLAASEAVWAQAEAWLDAEIEAEEKEWRSLELVINEYVGLPAYPVDKVSNANSDSLTLDTSFSTLYEGSLFENSPSLDAESGYLTPARSLDDGIIHITKQPRFSTPTSTSGGRALHEKLSSPDRRKSISPSESRKRLEAKLQAAELIRDRNKLEKVQKANKVTNRVNKVIMKQAETKALAEEALQDKLKNAEIRHSERLNEIREKAGHENAKVQDSLNSQTLADHLQSKLEEVELKILKANIRREQHLAIIASSQKKKNSKKVQQMSEFKLQLEKQKMERWEKLQKRFEAVQQRKEMRLAMLKKRDNDGVSTPNSQLSALPTIHETQSPQRVDYQVTCNLISMTPNITSLSPMLSESNQDCSNSLPCSPGLSLNHPIIQSDIFEERPVEYPANPFLSSEVCSDLIKKSWENFNSQLNKSKINLARNEAWLLSLQSMEESDLSPYSNDFSLKIVKYIESISGIKQSSTESLFKNLIEIILDVQDNPTDRNEREASSYNLYITIIRDIFDRGIVDNIDVIEKINFLIQSTLEGSLAKRPDFVRSCGLLLISLIFSSEFGLLSPSTPTKTIVSFISKEYQLYQKQKLFDNGLSNDFPQNLFLNMSPRSLNVGHIDYQNALLLVFNILQSLPPFSPSKNLNDSKDELDSLSSGKDFDYLEALLGCGIHIVIHDLISFSYFLIHSFVEYSNKALLNSDFTANDIKDALAMVRSYNSRLLLFQSRFIEQLNNRVKLHHEYSLSRPKFAGAIAHFMQWSYFTNSLNAVVDDSKLSLVNLQIDLQSLIQHQSFFPTPIFEKSLLLSRSMAQYLFSIANFLSFPTNLIPTLTVSVKHWMSVVRRSDAITVIINYFIFTIKYLLWMLSNAKSLSGILSNLLLNDIISTKGFLSSLLKWFSMETETIFNLSLDLKESFVAHCHYFLLISLFLQDKFHEPFSQFHKEKPLEKDNETSKTETNGSTDVGQVKNIATRREKMFLSLQLNSHDILQSLVPPGSSNDLFNKLSNEICSQLEASFIDMLSCLAIMVRSDLILKSLIHEPILLLLSGSFSHHRYSSAELNKENIFSTSSNQLQDNLFAQSFTLMHTLTSLPIRFFKDPHQKHPLHLCLLISCLENEKNFGIVKLTGKEKYLEKYLQFYSKECQLLAESKDNIACVDLRRREERLNYIQTLVPKDLFEVLLISFSK